MRLLTLDDFELKGKTIFLRVDHELQAVYTFMQLELQICPEKLF